MSVKTLVFETEGKGNTDATLQIAKERALALGITQVVVASSHGHTARKAQALFAPAGIKVMAIYIPHSHENKGWVMSAEEKAGLEKLGVIVHTGVAALVQYCPDIELVRVTRATTATIHVAFFAPRSARIWGNAGLLCPDARSQEGANQVERGIRHATRARPGLAGYVP